jgi:hypothetical protein
MRNAICQPHEAEMLDSDRGLQCGCHELISIGTEVYAWNKQVKQPTACPQSSFCTLIFVLMVKAVCGESRTYSLEGGKIPQGIYLSLHKFSIINGRNLRRVRPNSIQNL